jgi:hypothetical protein
MQDKPTPENLTRGDRNVGDMERDALYLLTDPCHSPTPLPRYRTMGFALLDIGGLYVP